MNQGEIIIYQTPDGETELNVNVGGDTVWLTQAQMAELFQRDRTVISRHINNVFKEGELDENTTRAFFAHIGENALRGQYETVLYNLDVIISVGYRVKSQRGTQFRIWANRVLKEYLSSRQSRRRRGIYLIHKSNSATRIYSVDSSSCDITLLYSPTNIVALTRNDILHYRRVS
jgi:hypothetical protein